MSVLQVRKRNGLIVAFDKNRIHSAISKAVESTPGITAEPTLNEEITDLVVTEVNNSYDGMEDLPTVENIQDIVEQKLVESGNFEIAKRYILYRAEHAQTRANARVEELQKLEKNMLKVIKSSGREEIFNISKIEKVITRAAKAFPNIDTGLVTAEVKKNVFDGITTKAISQALVMVGKSFIERDHDYSFFTSQLLLTTVYREVFGEKVPEDRFATSYAESFKKNLQKGVDAKRINPELLNFNFNKISTGLKPKRDQILTYLGLQTLYDRYFIHVHGTRIEAPQHFWMRVAMGLALGENENREERALEFYEVLSSLRFISSTPTLFNSGTTHPQLSSCYLSTVKDSLSHIFKVISDNAQLSKWAGGIGNDWTSVRATGARIEGTNGNSQGVIPFLKIANDTALAVNQGGKRKGAVCAYLECWHYDFEEFLELRKNTGDERRRTHDMSTASWIPDLFMKRVESEGEWTLFSPDETPELHELYGKAFEQKYEEYEAKADRNELKVFKRLPAAQLWRKMVTMLFETGHPWLTFKDPCNLRSPQDHTGVVHNSNLCTEITLNSSEDETAVCNLGSLNLAQHIDKASGDINRPLLEKTINTAMRMLDNVIDINLYPTQETRNANDRHRPVGMGMMGFQDVLYQKNLDFDSEVAVEFSDELMEFISYHAILASSHLAKERGNYKTFKGSKWDRNLLPIDTMETVAQERGADFPFPKGGKLDWAPVREHIAAHGMRNSNCLAIAPTATISNISGCIPCTEPIYKNLYVKSNMGGEFTIINYHLIEDLKKNNLWTPQLFQHIKANDGSIQDIHEIPIMIRDKYKEVFEIEPQWIIKHAAVRNKWLDQSQSVNIFYRGQSGKDISEIYKFAWKMGLKTTYYLRTLGASQVEKSTIGTHGTHKRDLGKNEKEAQDLPSKKEVNAAMCSILNGPDCEACQ